MRNDDDPKFLARVADKLAEFKRWAEVHPCPAVPEAERKHGELAEQHERRQKAIATKVVNDWITTGLNVGKADGFVRTRVTAHIKDERKGKVRRPARVQAVVEQLPEIVELNAVVTERKLPVAYRHATMIQGDLLSKGADKKLGRDTVIVHLDQERRKADAVSETIESLQRRNAELESTVSTLQTAISDQRALFQAVVGRADGALQAAE